MKKIVPVVFLIMGCASTNQATRDTGDSFAQAYHAVASGVRETARSGGYMMSRAGDATVRVIREASFDTGQGLTDAWITAEVQNKLGADRDLIKVTSDGGVVTLKGAVKSEAQAQKAIEGALQTDGVIAVDSQLVWPARASAK